MENRKKRTFTASQIAKNKINSDLKDNSYNQNINFNAQSSTALSTRKYSNTERMVLAVNNIHKRRTARTPVLYPSQL